MKTDRQTDRHTYSSVSHNGHHDICSPGDRLAVREIKIKKKINMSMQKVYSVDMYFHIHVSPRTCKQK